jgi:hypothetical protein
MKRYKLNAEQKALLRRLLQLLELGKLKEPITPVPGNNPTHFSIYLRGDKSFQFKRISDLDALCDAGLLTYRWNRQGTGKLYYLTVEAYAAVASNFDLPKTAVLPDIDLVELMRVMSGGAVEADELGTHLELFSVAHDPLERHTTVYTLVDHLLAFAQAELEWELFMPYQKQVRALQELLLGEEVDNGRLHIFAHHLAFPPTLTQRLDFSLRAWVYLYPLLLIGSARLDVDAQLLAKKLPNGLTQKAPAPFPSAE